MMTPKLSFSRIRKVKAPSYAHEGDAGIDFYVPEFDDKFIESFTSMNSFYRPSDLKNRSISLYPGERVQIPSGIVANIPDGYALVKFTKSGLSMKKGLDALAQVVDQGYQGEISLVVFNGSNKLQNIPENEKLFQFLLLPVAHAALSEKPLNQLFKVASERGTDGFGSTD